LFYRNNTLFHWIKYCPFSWGLKREDGVGITNEAQSLCTTYTDIIYDDLIASNHIMPSWIKINKHYRDRFKESLRTIISLRNRRIIEIILLEEYTNRAILKDEQKINHKSLFLLKSAPNTYLIKYLFVDKRIIFFSKIFPFIFDILKTLINTISFGDLMIIKTIFSNKSECDAKLKNDKSNKIFVQYFDHNFNGDRSPLIWYKHAKIKPNNIVMYFDRVDSPSTTKNINRIEKEGFHWVDTKNIYCLSNPLNVWLKCLKEILRMQFPKTFKPVEIWKYFLILELVCKTILWRDIFRKYNAKVIFQIEEGSTLQYCQLMAINLIDGIMIGFTWSFPFSNVRADEFHPQDVYFIWGQINRDWKINSHYRPKYLLTSGIIWDMSKENINIGLSLRKKFNDKVKYIMTLTDITFKDLSVDAFIKYYTTFLSYANKHHEWGVLIKPKKNRIWKDMGDNINNLVNELDSQKRLVVAKTQQSAMIAAYASDICIGLLINSAAVLAACRGAFSVCWDISGTPGHPLYNSDKSIIIHQHLADIVEILDNISKTSHSKFIRDENNSILNKIDPFRDGKGPNRVAQFIQNYITYINNQLNSNEALDKACNDYANDYGEDKVVNTYGGANKIIREKNLWNQKIEITPYKAISSI